MLKQAVWQGLVAGLAGAAAMTVAEKVEQRISALAARDGAGPGRRHAALAPGRRCGFGPPPR